jgi:tryptophan synthase alpha chain
VFNYHLEHRLQQKIAREEKVFIPYIMAGDGGLEKLKDKLIFLERSGATAIEIGIPFSDPVADGPVIQAAGNRALIEGTTLIMVLQKIADFREEINVPLIIMTYVNPIHKLGEAEFVSTARNAGIDGVIIPDLPIEHQKLLATQLKENKIALIQLVTITTPIERMKQIVNRAEGFVYAVTVTGITGSRTAFHNDIENFLTTLKSNSHVPILAGFGISTKEQAEQLGALCDGVIVGSKIVEYFHNNEQEKISAFMK